ALSRTLQTLEASACEGETLVIRCPASTMISVQYAKFGRSVPSRQMCPARAAHPPRVGHFYVDQQNVVTLGPPSVIEDTNCLAIRSLEARLRPAELSDQATLTTVDESLVASTLSVTAGWC
ncbi:hypothetical protein BaRGS_00022138, partial [Batillaria attramentaria]